MNTNVVLLFIGCGGTGSWAALPGLQYIAQYSKQNPSTNNRVLFIDADEVEEKNTIRQAFSMFDVGLPKAHALVSRYAPNFSHISNMSINTIQKFVLDDESRTEYLERFIDFDLAEEFTSSDSICIVFNVIDNNKTRKSVHRSFKKSTNLHYIIDAGNEDEYGQVTVTSYHPELSSNLKTFWELHPEMEAFNDGVKAGPSCAEHDEEMAANPNATQTMSANVVSASIMVDYLSKMLFGEVFCNETGFIVNSNNLQYTYT